MILLLQTPCLVLKGWVWVGGGIERPVKLAFPLGHGQSNKVHLKPWSAWKDIKTIVLSRKCSLSVNNRRKSSGGLLQEVGPISKDCLPAFYSTPSCLLLHSSREVSALGPEQVCPRIYFKHTLVLEPAQAGRNFHTGWWSVNIKYQISLIWVDKPVIARTSCDNEVLTWWLPGVRGSYLPSPTMAHPYFGRKNPGCPPNRPREFTTPNSGGELLGTAPPLSSQNLPHLLTDPLFKLEARLKGPTLIWEEFLCSVALDSCPDGDQVTGILGEYKGGQVFTL